MMQSGLTQKEQPFRPHSCGTGQYSAGGAGTAELQASPLYDSPFLPVRTETQC